MKKCIEINNLKKEYKDFKINNLSLEIPNGIIMGLIGENGAGKTTLIKCILNIINFDGDIKIFNKSIDSYERIIKKDIGVVLDNSFFPDIMGISDVRIIMRNTYENWDDSLFDKYLKEFKLFDKKDKIKTFSKGMKKKLEIAVALSHKPKLLILDEPTSGLDPVVRSEILDIFCDFVKDEEHCILLSTHITSDLEYIADSITFIDNGNIVFSDKKDNIINDYGLINCNKNEFDKLDNYIRYKKVKDNYSVLVKKNDVNVKTNKVTLDEIMVLYIKGE